MVSEQIRLCSLIIREYFGEVVERVSSTLHCGPRTLGLIITASRLPISKVKQALTVLIKYRLVTFTRGKITTVAEYKFHPNKVCLFLRYPRYIQMIKESVNEESSLLVDELIRFGFDTATNVILRVDSRIKKENLTLDGDLCSLRDKFFALIHAQYLIRCPHPSFEDTTLDVPILSVSESELFQPVDINMKCLSLFSQGMAAEDPGDKSVCWCINSDRFHQDIRDEIVLSAIERRYDRHAGQLMKELLRLTYLRTDPWAPQSNAVPLVELKDSMAKLTDNPYLAQYYDQYLKILEDSTGFVTRVDSSSGMIEVNMSKIIQVLTCNAIDNIVDQKFGAKSARIFRLVRDKKKVEQEQIQPLAMIQDKETKYLTYQLLQEGFLQMQELRKPVVSSGPNKSFLLFHINLSQVVRMTLDTCYKAMGNCLTRRDFEKNENMRLIEKKDKLETLLETMKEQIGEEELKEVEDDWLTPPERSLLESVEAMINKLSLAELQVDDTVFLLEMFSFYQTANIPKPNKIPR